MTDQTVSLSNNEWSLVVEAIDSELEHTNDMVREMDDTTDDDREAIRVQRIRQDRLETIREYILSATYVPSVR